MLKYFRRNVINHYLNTKQNALSNTIKAQIVILRKNKFASKQINDILNIPISTAYNLYKNI